MTDPFFMIRFLPNFSLEAPDVIKLLQDNSSYFQFCIARFEQERVDNAITVLNEQYSHLTDLIRHNTGLSGKMLFCIFNDDIDFCRKVYLYATENDISELMIKISLAYTKIIKLMSFAFAYNREILQFYQFLQKQIERASCPALDKNLVYQYLTINKNYLLEDQENNTDLFENYQEFFEEWERISLSQSLFENFKNYRVNFHTLPKNGEPDVCDKIISFCIPYKCTTSKIIVIDESMEIKIESCPADPFKDPCCNALWEFEMPISPIFISDIYDAIDASYIQIKIKNISISEEFSKEDSSDAKEYEALHDTPYCPDKQYIITLLRANFIAIKESVEIELYNININLFSNYNCSYFSGSINNTLCMGVHLLTSKDSFSNAHDRYQNILALRKSSPDVISQILRRDLFLSTSKALKDIILFVCKKTLIASIENDGCYQYFYNQDVPLAEPQLQPFIYSQLRPLLHYLGITISREPRLANGALDFLCSATNKSGERISVAIEMKKAEHSRLFHGIQTQLPCYMRAEDTKYGIFLVLWFKSETYNHPNGFKSIEVLKSKLDEIKPKKQIFIDTLIVDCVKQSSPSKK